MPELQFFSFKTKTESQILDLLSKMSEQNQFIDACKQDLCKLRSENLNLISRISFLEKKLSIVNHSEYDFNEQQSNNVRHQTSKPTSPPKSIVRHTSRQSDKPNRSPNRDVNAIPKKDISQPEVLFVSSTSKPVYIQITHQFIEAVSPALSLSSAKQKSSQSDDSIKVSNVRSVRKSASKLLSEKSAKDTVQVNSGTNNLTNLLNSKPESVHVNHQCSEPFNLSNAEPSRNHDQTMAHSYESFPAFNLPDPFPASRQTNSNYVQFRKPTEPQKYPCIPSFRPHFLERCLSIPSYRTGYRFHSLEWLVHLSVVSQLTKG
jgi:hypothetical protein